MAVESIPSTSNNLIHYDRLLCQICFKWEGTNSKALTCSKKESNKWDRKSHEYNAVNSFVT